MSVPSGYALVTGGAKGLGGAISRFLAEQGYRVMIHYHTSEGTAEHLRDEIHANGGYVELYQADLTHPVDRERMVKDFAFSSKYQAQTVPLRVLVNNAGYYPMRKIDDLDLYAWNKSLELNLTAPFDLIELCEKYMARRNSHTPTAIPARIINIGDVAAGQLQSRSIALPYYIAKTGLLQLTRSFATRFAKDGITVNMVSPGYLDNSVNERDNFVMPMGRKGTFDDVIGAIEYLLSDDAWYVSGANIQVSGAWRV